MSVPDIFLSYNREDAAAAKTYADAFAREGLEVWWDATLRSGEAYDEVTEAALRGAKAVVVLWSPRSVASRWVRAEATIAERNRTLMPVTIAPCERPVMFELTQTADLSHWRGDADDKAWLAFLGDVRRMVGRDDDRQNQAALSPAVPATAAAGGVPIVAVLPLSHRAGDDEMEVLAEDLTEEITRELAQNSFFRVIAVGTVTSWREKAMDHRSLGRGLEASYLVEGKLQRAGEVVRLTMQLIDTATGSMLRSLRFVGNLLEMARTPEDFPVTVGCELGERITKIETNRAMTKQGPFSGWEHVLRAMAFKERMGQQSEHRGLEEARHAVSVAPDLGLAHSALANYIASVAVLDLGELDEPRRREIHEHIKRAMQLDGDNPAILNHLVTAYGILGDGEAGLRLARRAIELAPNSPLAQFAFGHAYFALGHIAEAHAAVDKQLRLAPHDLNRPAALLLLGVCLCLEGEPAEAEAALDRSLALSPDYGVALMWKSVVATQQGRDHAARATVLQLREAEPEMSIDQHLRLLVYYPVFRERLTEAVAIFRRLWDETGGDA